MIVSIQKVTEENFETLTGLIKKLAIYEKITPPAIEEITRLRQDSLGNQPKLEAFIAYFDNKPVGYMILLMTYSSFLALPTLYIEDLFVLEEYRQQGTGKALLDYIKDLAKERGCGRIEWTVLDWNEPAIKFYEKHGGKHLKDWRFYRLELK